MKNQNHSNSYASASRNGTPRKSCDTSVTRHTVKKTGEGGEGSESAERLLL